MRRALYGVLLIATTSLGACDSRPISGSLGESNRTPNGGDPGPVGSGPNGAVLPEDVPPGNFSACTTNTWQSYAQAQLVAGCTRCHSEMSAYAGVSAQSARIRDSIAAATMPTDAALSADDIAKLTRWVDCDLAP